MRGIDSAWDFVWRRLFSDKTMLFYDQLVSDEADANICHLPSPLLVRNQVPSPCGWSTGMEDSVLNGGTMLGAVTARYEATGDLDMRQYARDIFKGLMLCASVSDSAGYLPRSVSPADCKSHYGNSSIDQYTYWISGAYSYYNSELCSDGEREDIRRVLVSFAEKAQREVIPENDYNMLREDGKIGIICRMWGDVAAHEYLRLPMFYAAAWKVSGDGHWHDMYMKYRDSALEATLKFSPDKVWHCYATLQMTYSVKLLYDIDEDEAFRAKCRAFMEKLADYSRAHAIRLSDELCKPEHKAEFAYKYLPWDKVNARYIGFYGGRMYYNPLQDNKVHYPMRDVGDSAAIAALCGYYGDELVNAVTKLSDAVDYVKCYHFAPINLINGYWLLMRNKSK